MKLYAYKMGSQSAKALAASLGIKRVKHDGDVLGIKGTLINWGAGSFKRPIRLLNDAVVLNPPDAVKKASNKLKTFEALQGKVSIPEFTTSRKVAVAWSMNNDIVVAREKLTGHSGEGIVIVNEEYLVDNSVPEAPLYTKYINKKEEYRIHVFRGEAFFLQRKARKMDVPDEQVNWKVRNLAGGFIFANKGIEVPDIAKTEAINAVKALGLDFGAVDIILGTDKKFYVLEVNTACGLEGTTLEKYVEKFQQFR